MRVLLVEDEVKMARALRRGLEHEGHAVDAADDGDEALRRALENEYDAIVLDVMLPGRDGFSVCRELAVERPVGAGPDADRARRGRGPDPRARRRRRRLPRQAVRVRRAARAPARAGAAGRRPSDRPRSPSATWCSTRRRIPSRAAASTIDSHAREFALLEFLMRHPGEVVSRARILEHVWDVNYDGFSNVVDVYVGYLRRKLEHAVRPTVHPDGPRGRVRGRASREPADPRPAHALVRRAARRLPGRARRRSSWFARAAGLLGGSRREPVARAPRRSRSACAAGARASSRT